MPDKRYAIFEISPENADKDCDGCDFADCQCPYQLEDVEDEGDSVIISWMRGPYCLEREKQYLTLLLQASMGD